jgi:hypothetical protein
MWLIKSTRSRSRRTGAASSTISTASTAKRFCDDSGDLRSLRAGLTAVAAAVDASGIGFAAPASAGWETQAFALRDYPLRHLAAVSCDR